ncbi:demethylmenaquinone methyltransferase/2-methoxy-6-polyprenyl-1 [Sporomusaceae bacterium BoRhaA]|uniref:bifunctional demethylmenaquinone methyltransferase/2-methoxy-6-polyprenyl-1,4-benzoquinol methylase UbiE n=1 Tax=Pelorhabdus rhamnosifermentans TaxID=2772457 RepID=UPI001C0637E0|nr:bifunctional demethylmenaquinone methyltransferase/2-methoxy-6-polyprenyl-1,4-benzoquinol methylase UbiE [Pelorhabdus rhamnosifermentans]MBU2702368.1 demethylmenaquinone methyltransferase/2-methoxy-6-polyprenyl-1 [Pelorhabdus rhamnosifermentans]
MIKKIDRPSVLNAKEKEQFVHGIFSAIACRYDWLNSILSIKLDGFWRRYAVTKAKVPTGGKTLDLCCGTGKLTLELIKAVGAGGSVIGVDFCANMLQIARENISKTMYVDNVMFVEANVLELPFTDHSFDCCTIGFGMRNVADIPRVISEIYRVLKPGGRLVILELGKPSMPVFRSLYFFYFERILPVLGQAFAKVKGAYQWLPESLRFFPDQQEVVRMLQESGFKDVGRDNLTGGIVAVYFGVK